jgi:hypothetical protein
MSRDWKHVLASFSLKFKTEKDVQAPYGQLGKQSRKQPPDFSALKFFNEFHEWYFKKSNPWLNFLATRLNNEHRSSNID